MEDLTSFEDKAETMSVSELKKQLEKTVDDWVHRTFNFIQLSVVQKVADDMLSEHIRSVQKEDVFLDWLLEYQVVSKLVEYAEAKGIQLDNVEEKYSENQESLSDFLYNLLEEQGIADFQEWCFETFEDDIDDYINEQQGDNYPMWNTLFEWRDSYYNSEETTQKCIEAGIGVVESFEDFNNLLFFSGCGYSFYAKHWIPLYLSLFEREAEKYKGIDYSDL